MAKKRLPVGDNDAFGVASLQGEPFSLGSLVAAQPPPVQPAPAPLEPHLDGLKEAGPQQGDVPARPLEGEPAAGRTPTKAFEATRERAAGANDISTITPVKAPRVPSPKGGVAAAAEPPAAPAPSQTGSEAVRDSLYIPRTLQERVQRAAWWLREAKNDIYREGIEARIAELEAEHGGPFDPIPSSKGLRRGRRS